MSASPDAAREDLRSWLIAAGRGERGAFAAVYRATSAKLFAVILRICRDRESAEEVLQEVFATVWARAAQYDPARASPITWLATIARNRAIDWVRARGSRPTPAPIEAAEHVADGATPADLDLQAAQDRARLQLCLDELEPRQARAIRTAFFEGLTYEELARREQVAVGTMKSWIRRGLIRLRGCLQA